MNEKFFELPDEKKTRIINAGFRVFSENEYKRASTEEIARVAGLSKGLLFYYFHNKKELYLYLFECGMEIVNNNVVNADYDSYTDFFELCEYAAHQKLKIIESNPYIMDFLLSAYYSQKEDVSKELSARITETLATMYQKYFSHIDITKFKDGVSLNEILQMITWMSEGYVQDKRRAGAAICMNEYMSLYRRWCVLLKQIAYKDEFIK